MKTGLMVLLPLVLVACGKVESDNSASKGTEKGMAEKEEKERLYGSFAYGPYEGEVLFPEVDPNIRWDEDLKAVVDSTTGEYLTGGGGGSDRIVHFGLRSKEGEALLGFDGYVGSFEKPGFGNSRAYQIIRVYDGGTHRQEVRLSESQYDLKRFAQFVNQYRGKMGAGKSAGNVVVVDIRKSWAEIWDKKR